MSWGAPDHDDRRLRPGSDDSGSLEEREDDHQADDGEMMLVKLSRRPISGGLSVWCEVSRLHRPSQARVLASARHLAGGGRRLHMVQAAPSPRARRGNVDASWATVMHARCSGDKLDHAPFGSAAMVPKTRPGRKYGCANVSLRPRPVGERGCGGNSFGVLHSAGESTSSGRPRSSSPGQGVPGQIEASPTCIGTGARASRCC